MKHKIYPKRKKLETRFKAQIGPGRFFITMVSHKRRPVFGKIVDEKVVLSEVGEVVKKLWIGQPDYHPQLILGEFIFMPDHFHGIIEICKNEGLPDISLSKIIHSFKTISSREYIKFGKDNHIQSIGKLWQRGYNEAWIKGDEAYSNLEKYIRDNPKKIK